MSTSIFDQDLPRSEANHAVLSPLSFIQRSAAVYPDLPAIVHGFGAQVILQNWAAPCRRWRKPAAALAQEGVNKGDTLASSLPTTPAMVDAHFGVPMTGAVLNTLNTRLDAATIAFMLDHAEASVVL